MPRDKNQPLMKIENLFVTEKTGEKEKDFYRSKNINKLINYYFNRKLVPNIDSVEKSFCNAIVPLLQEIVKFRSNTKNEIDNNVADIITTLKKNIKQINTIAVNSNYSPELKSIAAAAVAFCEKSIKRRLEHHKRIDLFEAVNEHEHDVEHIDTVYAGVPKKSFLERSASIIKNLKPEEVTDDEIEVQPLLEAKVDDLPIAKALGNGNYGVVNLVTVQGKLLTQLQDLQLCPKHYLFYMDKEPSLTNLPTNLADNPNTFYIITNTGFYLVDTVTKSILNLATKGDKKTANDFSILQNDSSFQNVASKINTFVALNQKQLETIKFVTKNVPYEYVTKKQISKPSPTETELDNFIAEGNAGEILRQQFVSKKEKMPAYNLNTLAAEVTERGDFLRPIIFSRYEANGSVESYLKEKNIHDPNYDRSAVLGQMFITLVQGVKRMHEAGLLHLDIAPRNVLVDASGRAILADYGLHHSCDGNNPVPIHVTTGPIKWMDSQRLTQEQCSPHSDFFALRVTMWEMLVEASGIDKYELKFHKDDFLAIPKIFLMAPPLDGKYEASSIKHLYLYRNNGRILYFAQDNNEIKEHYLDGIEFPGDEAFTSNNDNLIQCHTNEINDAVLTVTSKRGHTRDCFYRILTKEGESSLMGKYIDDFKNVLDKNTAINPIEKDKINDLISCFYDFLVKDNSKFTYSSYDERIKNLYADFLNGCTRLAQFNPSFKTSYQSSKIENELNDAIITLSRNPYQRLIPETTQFQSQEDAQKVNDSSANFNIDSSLRASKKNKGGQKEIIISEDEINVSDDEINTFHNANLSKEALAAYEDEIKFATEQMNAVIKRLESYIKPRKTKDQLTKRRDEALEAILNDFKLSLKKMNMVKDDKLTVDALSNRITYLENIIQDDAAVLQLHHKRTRKDKSEKTTAIELLSTLLNKTKILYNLQTPQEKNIPDDSLPNIVVNRVSENQQTEAEKKKHDNEVNNNLKEIYTTQNSFHNSMKEFVDYFYDTQNNLNIGNIFAEDKILLDYFLKPYRDLIRNPLPIEERSGDVTQAIQMSDLQRATDLFKGPDLSLLAIKQAVINQKAFDAFLKYLEKKLKIKINIQSRLTNHYTIMPTQRLMKYHMFFENIMKHATNDGLFELAKESHQLAAKFATDVNAAAPVALETGERFFKRFSENIKKQQNTAFEKAKNNFVKKIATLNLSFDTKNINTCLDKLFTDINNQERKKPEDLLDVNHVISIVQRLSEKNSLGEMDAYLNTEFSNNRNFLKNPLFTTPLKNLHNAIKNKQQNTELENATKSLQEKITALNLGFDTPEINTNLEKLLAAIKNQEKKSDGTLHTPFKIRFLNINTKTDDTKPADFLDASHVISIVQHLAEKNSLGDMHTYLITALSPNQNRHFLKNPLFTGPLKELQSAINGAYAKQLGVEDEKKRAAEEAKNIITDPELVTVLNNFLKGLDETVAAMDKCVRTIEKFIDNMPASRSDPRLFAPAPASQINNQSNKKEDSKEEIPLQPHRRP